MSHRRARRSTSPGPFSPITGADFTVLDQFRIVVLVFTYAVAYALKFTMITYLLDKVFTYGVFALLIIFQPELRAALAHIGQARGVGRFFRRMEVSEVAEEIADAVERLSRSG